MFNQVAMLKQINGAFVDELPYRPDKADVQRMANMAKRGNIAARMLCNQQAILLHLHGKAGSFGQLLYPATDGQKQLAATNIRGAMSAVL